MGSRPPMNSSPEPRCMRPQGPPPPRRFGSMADVMLRARPVSAPPPVARARRVAVHEHDAVVCDACGSGDREGQLLLCDGDGCNRGRHTYCLHPVAAVEIPDGPWFCSPTCAPPARPVESRMDEVDAFERASSSSKKDNISMPNSKIKPIIEPNPLSKDSINSSNFRGFHLPNIFKTSNLELLQKSTNTTQNTESKLTLDVRTPKTRPISVDKNQGASTSNDFESACKVMLGSTNLSLPVLCGEVTHPDVDEFIKSTITGVAREEESIQKHIQSIEPVIVNQCCDMVKSLCSIHQQTRCDSTLNGPNMINPSSEHEKYEAPDSHTLCRFEHLEQLEIEAHASNNSYPNVEWCEKPMICLTCDSDMVFGKEHTCNIPDQSKTTTLFRPTVSGMIGDVIEDILSSEASITDEAKVSIALSGGNVSDGILKQRDTAAALKSLVISDKEDDSLNLSTSTYNREIVFGTNFAHIAEHVVHNEDIVTKSFAKARASAEIHDLPATPCDSEKLIPSCSKAKRNFILADDGTIFHPDSPQKKLKFPPHSTAKCDGGSDTSWKAQREPSCSQKSDGDHPRGSREPYANTTNSSNNVNSPNATPNVGARDGMKSKATKYNLSELGHKKHAMKAPGPPLFNGEKIEGQKIVISRFENDVYYAGTKKVKDGNSTECANIGRMSITHKEFGDAMRPRTWVNTCAMNVYCEALAYDQSEEVMPTIMKGFLTSAEVHYMKKNDLDINILKKKLALKAIRFELDKVDMVMIPACHGNHWWLVVANIRDKRFDVLSSCKFEKREEQVTHTIRMNFVRAFEAMYKLKGDTKFSEFPTVYQDAPQQGTNYDCGIFVMNFMASWDGTSVAQIHKDQIYNYRVKVVVYMLCHPANNKKLPAVMKLMQKNEGVYGEWGVLLFASMYCLVVCCWMEDFTVLWGKSKENKTAQYNRVNTMDIGEDEQEHKQTEDQMEETLAFTVDQV